MRIRGRNHLSSLVLIAVLAVITAGYVQAGVEDEIKREFEVSPGDRLIVDTDRGSIEVETKGAGNLEVKIILEANTRDEDKARELFDRFSVDFEQDGSDIYITGDMDDEDGDWHFWKKWGNRLAVKFVFLVPEELDLDIETSAGSVSVADLKGDIKAKTSGGSMAFAHIQGLVNAKTSGGSISLESCLGRAEVRTSGGSISIGTVEGDVVAHTSGGGISIEEVMGSIDASTSGGSVQARITSQPRDDCRLVTSGGSVSVYLDPELDFDLDAKTSAGYVETDFPVKVNGRISRSSLRSEINNGGPKLYLRTSAGNINLYKI